MQAMSLINRNACGTFLEYLLSGRLIVLDATQGCSGAYIVFEGNLFHRHIADKLDQIMENQKILIRGQKEMSQKIDTLLYGVEKYMRNFGE